MSMPLWPGQLICFEWIDKKKTLLVISVIPKARFNKFTEATAMACDGQLHQFRAEDVDEDSWRVVSKKGNR